MANDKKIVWAIVLICGIISICLFTYLKLSHKDPILLPELYTINSARATTPIEFSVKTDKYNDLLVGWTSEDRGLNFQKSTDRGVTWSEPFPLSSGAIGVPFYSEIAVVGDTICAFGIFRDPNTYIWGDHGIVGDIEHGGLVQRMSTDGGISWSDEKKVLTGDSQSAGGFIESFSVVAFEDTLYLVCESKIKTKNGVEKIGTFFAKTTDYGSSWTTPQYVKVRPLGTNGYINYSMAINEGVIHLLYQTNSRSNNLGRSLFYTRGLGLGNDWQWPTTINVDRGKYSPSTQASNVIIPKPSNVKLTICNKDLIISYLDWGLYGKLSENNGVSWQDLNLISEYNVIDYSFSSSDSGCLIISWIDTRYQSKKWWAYLPLNQIFFTDADPNLENNDVFYTIYLKNGLGKAKRLTPPSSFSLSTESITLNDTTYIFWSGKRKIGEHVITSPAPYEIFMMRIEDR